MNNAAAKAGDVPADEAKSAPGLSNRQWVVGTIAVIVLLLGGAFGIRKWQFFIAHEETDDAQVEGDVSPVLPRVSGYVTQVLIADNDHVNVGQPVIQIDARELEVRVNGARAALDNAVAEETTAAANLKSAQAQVVTADANVATARIRQKKAADDLIRDAGLSKTGAITTSQLEDTQAAADTAAAQLAAVQSEAATARAQVDVAAARLHAARTLKAEKQSDLDYAELQLSYHTVTAPIAGIVSRKSVEPGQFVQAGQTLFSLASDRQVWVVANFKETQLTHMKVGQPVEFEADSYPGVVFHGQVQSIGGATGARFALLPPDNSTGNFVKVTQRVPVKITLAAEPDADHALRPGMSVDATVSIK
jgi:membrane fusion protein (multidrug efflux system)